VMNHLGRVQTRAMSIDEPKTDDSERSRLAYVVAVVGASLSTYLIDRYLIRGNSCRNQDIPTPHWVGLVACAACLGGAAVLLIVRRWTARQVGKGILFSVLAGIPLGWVFENILWYFDCAGTFQ